MKQIALFFFLFAAVFVSVAQFVPVADLQAQLQTTTDGAKKEMLLLQLAEELLNSDPAQSLTRAQEALLLSQASGSKANEATALSLLGVSNFKTDHASRAKELIDEALAIALEKKDNARVGLLQVLVGAHGGNARALQQSSGALPRWYRVGTSEW